MHKPLLAAMAMVLLLGACGGFTGSRLNPMNWFGRDSAETLAPAGGWTTTVDRRLLVPVVSEMEVLRTSTGALVRAAGITERQGFWDVELRPENDGRPVDGVLTYEFVAAAPRGQTAVSTDPSRTVTAAVAIPNSRLAGVRQIVVRGGQNARSVNR